ncbi:hypothetical protein DPMN_075769 [Dreissena polymorpha]|uniref:Uncharacterized protein n=1 Tax=Dreissena polymorpha TaxID=45954 RepID=A0A9D3YL10_DREPO|nr:hypothetical protein DPMN_075769 [Dreissena polymorpha]
MLKADVEEAVHCQEAGKSLGQNNVPNHLIKHVGDATIVAMTALSQILAERILLRSGLSLY